VSRTRQPVKCGTYGGYQAHKRRKEDACDDCKAANTEYRRGARLRPPTKPQIQPLDPAQVRPACRSSDYKLFDSYHPDSHMAARRFCARCPMVIDCLNRALGIAGENAPGDVRAPFGTWGGLLWKSGSVVPAEVPSAYETVQLILKERAA
jgi:hypothetical protein